MLTITKPGPNRLNIVFDGHIDADQMRVALDDFIALSDDIEHGCLHYTIPEVSLPTLSAIGVKFGMLPKLLSVVRKFDRIAVVSDAGWVRTAAGIEGALFPGPKIKGFSAEEGEAAEAWLSGGGAAPA